MPSFSYSRSLNGAGMSIGRAIVRTGDHPNPYEVSLPVALAVTGWVKTDADTAVCNEPASYAGDGTYDVYWSGGMRYGVAVSQVGTTGTLALEGGAGTDFPANGTACTICLQTVINTQIDGDAVEILGLELHYDDPDSTSLGHVDMQDSGNATIEEIDLGANNAVVYDIDGGDTNVFTGNPITHTHASHNDTINTAKLKILSLEDATP